MTVLADGTVEDVSKRPRRSQQLLTRYGAIAGLVPFAAYIAIFLVLPTAIALFSGLVDGDGNFTLSNVQALADPLVVRGFWATTWLSALTAAVGAVLGALACYAMIGLASGSRVRTAVDAFCGVLAQFGGVMLAFAFIATMGLQGVVTVLLNDHFGINIFANGPWIYSLRGLILPYIYFQAPLMVIVFLPAMQGLKREWSEANLMLGGNRRTFWTHVAIPVLAPSFLASYLLLFANAFSSYATAAALVSQGAPITPLQIRAALTSETILGRENMAGALALGMVVVMGLVMWVYALVQRRAARWQG